MDTALWVAYHRGLESTRQNPLYHDPLALKLAGDQGQRIAARMSSESFMSWMMALRTRAIDDLIFGAVADGVRTIVNLGAGLDTRPYRMKLPNEVQWIEADFPDMIHYKESILSTERPLVSLRRASLDLSDRAQAKDFYQRLAQENGPILVITEGLIPYLDNQAVEQLAMDLAAVDKIKFWIQDFRHGGYAQGIPKLWFMLKMRRAPMKFKVGHWFDFFLRFGWRMRRQMLLSDLAETYGRQMPAPKGAGLLMALWPKKSFANYGRSTGFALFERC
jgi:methyltransferase (TIGR00027 family)